MTHAIFQPMLALIALTGTVWVVLFALRVPYIFKNNIPMDRLTAPEQAAAEFSERVNYPSHNFKNLFELPVVFYALCGIAYAGNWVDDTLLTLAWVFVGFRVLHSLIQCSYNDVNHRFATYLVSSLALWAMTVKLLWVAF